MLQAKKLPEILWAEAIYTAVDILNPTVNTQFKKTPLEGWTGQIPDLKHIKIFGSDAYVHIPKEKRSKSFRPLNSRISFCLVKKCDKN